MKLPMKINRKRKARNKFIICAEYEKDHNSGINMPYCIFVCKETDPSDDGQRKRTSRGACCGNAT